MLNTEFVKLKQLVKELNALKVLSKTYLVTDLDSLQKIIETLIKTLSDYNELSCKITLVSKEIANLTNKSNGFLDESGSVKDEISIVEIQNHLNNIKFVRAEHDHLVEMQSNCETARMILMEVMKIVHPN
jgi:hypothetical protein